MFLDGYYDGPGENVMVMALDEAFDAYNAERLRAADTLLLGARSYRGFKGFWPPMADDTDPWRSTTRIVRRADAHRRIAELKGQPGREILMFRSRTLWNDLLAHNLVVRYQLGPDAG
jgi:hypothetical protein